MSEPRLEHPPARWYRSLYWRIALGLVAFLALMLAAQGALFVWMVDRTAGSIPARSPRRLAVIVASDVAAALDADPGIDLGQYIREQYAHVFQPFVLLMRDGRAISNRSEIPAELQDAVASEAARPDPPFREDRRRRGGRDLAAGALRGQPPRQLVIATVPVTNPRSAAFGAGSLSFPHGGAVTPRREPDRARTP